MTDKNDSDYKIEKRINAAWKESLSEWNLRSVDHYHRTILDQRVAGIGGNFHMLRSRDMRRHQSAESWIGIA